MFRAAVIGWLFGKAIVGLMRSVVWLVEGAAYLIGAAGGLASAWRVGRHGRSRDSAA